MQKHPKPGQRRWWAKWFPASYVIHFALSERHDTFCGAPERAAGHCDSDEHFASAEEIRAGVNLSPPNFRYCRRCAKKALAQLEAEKDMAPCPECKLPCASTSKCPACLKEGCLECGPNPPENPTCRACRYRTL